MPTTPDPTTPDHAVPDHAVPAPPDRDAPGTAAPSAALAWLAATLGGTPAVAVDGTPPLPVTAWLPTPTTPACPLGRRPGVGRPTRDSAVLADLRSRFPGVDPGAPRLNHALAEALRVQFLAHWRTVLGLGADVELVVRTPRPYEGAGALVQAGRPEALLVTLAVSTAVPRRALGQANMAELHAQGYVGYRAVRAGQAATAGARSRIVRVPAARCRTVLHALAADEPARRRARALAGRRARGTTTLGVLVDDACSVLAGPLDAAGWAALTAALTSAGVLAGPDGLADPSGAQGA